MLVGRSKSTVIRGVWYSGVALDLHTLSSVHLGVDEHGHDGFETANTELGALLYRLKYKSDPSAVADIVQTAVTYLRPRLSKFALIVPVPPSRPRSLQPVITLAQGIGSQLNVPVAIDCVGITRPAAQLKDVSNPEERRSLVAGLYTANAAIIKDKNVLLFDDLFRSGATMDAITEVLMKDGQAARVHALTITRTRSNR